MSFLTVLRSFGRVLTKRWQPDGTIAGYDNAKQFTTQRRPVTSLNDLAACLVELEDDPHACVVRGALVGDQDLARLLPELVNQERKNTPAFRLQDGAVLRNGKLFRDHPQQWLMLDIDDFEPTGADPVLMPEQACLEFVGKMLPPEFVGRGFFWSLSGSAGHATKAGKLKAHLWFWLDEPRTSAQLRAWALSVPGIDKAIYSPVQVHYTAAPIMAPQLGRIVPTRSGLLVGPRGEQVPLQLGSAVHAIHRAPTRAAMADPADKPGIIGAFCRVHRPSDLETILGDMFEQGRDTRHYSWIEGDHAPDGVFITECGHGLVSVHASAPTGQGRRVNVFDFARLHLFGHFDESASIGTAMSLLPSFKAMNAWIAENCPQVLDDMANDGSTPEEAFPDDKPTADELVALFRGMPLRDLEASWAASAMHLSKGEVGKVVAEVAHLTRTTPRALNASLADAQQRARDAERLKRFGEHTAGRRSVHYRPQDQTAIAREIEATILANVEPGEYIDFAGVLSHVALRDLPHSHLIGDADSAPPPIPQIEPLSAVEMRAKSEAAVVLHRIGKQGPEPIAIPKSIIDILLGKAYHAAPKVHGLITHPIVLPRGDILAIDGLDETSRLFAQRAAIDGCRPYSKGEAAAAFGRLQKEFLRGFEFATPLDEAAAVASLFTGVQRRLLDKAPGVMILAASPSSGKTTLARLMHLVLTGHDMPVCTFPECNDEEAAKQLLAMLLRSPAIVCFDNLTEGTTFRSPTLAAALTSGEFQRRLLGENREARVPTNVLFVLTGNNVSVGIDFASRLLTIRLAPKTARPEQRTFEHPDVPARARQIRDDVLRDVVGIIAGYLASNERVAPRTRFELWDRMVRQSLMWAGAPDVADVFTSNAASSGESSAVRGLLQVLSEKFANASFSAREVANIDPFGDEGEPLRKFMTTLRAKSSSDPVSVGRVLGSVCDRFVDVSEGTTLVLRSTRVNNALRYHVEVIDE